MLFILHDITDTVTSCHSVRNVMQNEKLLKNIEDIQRRQLANTITLTTTINLI